MLLLDLVRFEGGQAAEGQLEDRLRLDEGQLEALDQSGPRRLGVTRGADECDHLVEVGQGDEQALQDVGAILGAAQLVLRAPHDDLALVVDVVADDLAQRQGARHVVDEGDHVDAECVLHRRVLVELVEHDLGKRVALELDHEPHPVAIGFVAQVADLGDLLVDHEVADLEDQAPVATLADLVGQLGDDDRLLALPDRLDVRLGLDADPAATGGVGVADALASEDRPRRREVGALDVLHQPLDVDRRIVDVGDGGPDDLAEVVGRDVRRHADRDPGAAVDEQVGEAGREHERLLAGAVIGGREVDGLGVDVAQHLGGQPVQARLGVAHRRRGVAVDVAEVAVPVDERIAHREVLGETHERVVDRRVAVRVVLAHHLADDLGALDVLAVGLQAQLVHHVEHAAVHRLQTVAHVREGAPDDDRHGVVQVRRAHLLLEPAGLDVAAADGVDC